jgi:hypothetical protein
MTTCQETTVAVTVENQGPLTWGLAGQQPYHLSYHWLGVGSQVAIFEGIRTNLVGTLPPGGRQVFTAKVRAPFHPGQYGLVWDMVQEEVTWFSLKSAHYTVIPVQVVADGTNTNSVQKNCDPPSRLGAKTRATPAQLPTVQSQPDRTELWPAALAMLKARPLLGVGPNGFRLNYGNFVSPPMANWDKGIFANNLLLEIAADLGLVGGGLLVALLAVLLWPMLVGIRRGTVLVSSQVAVVGALASFFGHGLVDYILEADSINLLFWILVGLVAGWLNPISLKE